MRTFVCRYGTPAGRIETEHREAEDAAAARRDLERRGLLVLSVAPVTRWRLVPAALGARRRVGRRDLLVVSQELLALVRAGLPIRDGLDLLERRCAHPALRSTLAAVRADVTAGVALSDALARHPRVFPPLYAASLRAGERSGALAECLASYLALLRRTLALRKRLVGALLYPAILLGLSLAVVAFLLTYVVPTFANVYAGLKAALPGPTLVLVQVTAVAKALALPLALAAAAGVAALARFARTTQGRRRIDAALLRLPLVGDALRRYAAALFCRTFATVLAGGIPAVPALETAADAVGNAEVRARLLAQVPDIEAGRPVSAALEATGAFPATAVEMVAVGESTGALPEMLGHVADFFDEDLDTRLQSLGATLEPLIMVVMGLVIGTIVVVMYLPIFDVSRAIR